MNREREQENGKERETECERKKTVREPGEDTVESDGEGVARRRR